MLRALTWGPPVGTLSPGRRSAGTAALVERGWLEHTVDAAGRTRFILPREVGLALRGGRLNRQPLAPPATDALEVLPAGTIASEAVNHAEEVVRLTRELLTDWGREGGQILRTGGVGVRALDRTAAALGLERGAAASVIEFAAGAELLGLDESGAAWVPADTVPAWLDAELPEQWAMLAAAWADSARTPWLVGTRADDGALRPVLGADVEAPGRVDCAAASWPCSTPCPPAPPLMPTGCTPPSPSRGRVGPCPRGRWRRCSPRRSCSVSPAAAP
ncbi:hypothetical protein [Actinomyces ruminis]|uniref:hypothetical protein n=1 Tax=Actinomyces ruminis TaxID=1937003 RepID=UPI00211ECB21|nr:hypothetical protein [Actinomyces ruminis]